jgi:hypothetical protein
MPDDQNRPLLEQFAVPIFCSLLGGPFASAGAKEMINGSITQGAVGLFIGIGIGIGGLTFYKWKDHLNRANFRWIVRTAERGWPLALGFAFLYVIGFFQAPAQHPGSSQPPTASANEIADAVVQKLAKTNPSIPPTTPAAVPPYVNPIHTAETKWNMSSGIRSGIIHRNLPADCQITITRLPVTYAEDLAADLKSILDVIGWKYEERLATTTVDKEIAIRILEGNGLPQACATALASRLQNDGRTRTNGSYNTAVRGLTEPEAPDFLKHCTSACIEVTIGNEDTLR